MSVKPVLTIIGGGMGHPCQLTGEAREAIVTAARLYAAPRLAGCFAALNPVVIAATLEEIWVGLAYDHSDAAVIVSGDGGFFSLAATLCREWGETYDIRILGGISSLQALCGRLRIPWDDVKVISLHGRPGSVAGAVSYNKRTFVLTGKGGTEAIVEEICRLGLGHVVVTVGENLSLPGERLVTAPAGELLGRAFGDLAVVLMENPRPVDPFARLTDGDFLRGSTPMTKASVRDLTLARLAVRPTDTVWDIGAGTGSVSVALARAARDGTVWAVERGPAALELIRVNRAALGAYNIQVVEGEAPGCLAELPLPDKVFLGGTGGQMGALLAWLTQIVPAFDLCLNAVTLNSVAEALEGMDALGFGEIQVECVNISGAKTVGGYRMMLAQNPVHIISGRWRR